MYNDVMMQLDRMFIDPNGLPGRPLMRSVNKIMINFVILITNEICHAVGTSHATPKLR